MKYRGEIDGLRAVAVLPVILFHAGFEYFSGGFVGVDVFFVISGYLITTIILSEMDCEKFSLINFYERRARRILPALFFMMLVTLPFAWFWLDPTDLKEFAKSLVAVPAFASNILFWKETDYFAAATELKPLLHTWSLAVEEQYYVLFPLLLMFMWQVRKRWILGTLAVIALLSLFASHWAAYNYQSANFYLLPTRLWELAVGAMIAFFFIYRESDIDKLRSKTILSNGLAIFGFVLIIYSVVAYDKTVPFPSLYALAPVMGTGLIIVFATSETVIGKLLQAKIFVGIGLISYSAYLWHQPIFAFARHRVWDFNEFLAISLILATFVCAYLSWRFVEKPLRHKGIFGRRQIFTYSAIGSVFFVVIGMLGVKNNGFEERFNKEMPLNYQADNRLLQVNSWQYLRKLSADPNYAVDNNDHDLNLWFNVNDHRSRLLLVGNSHSKDMYNVLHNSKIATQHFQIARYGTQIKNIDKAFFSSQNYQNAELVLFVSQFSEEEFPLLQAITEKIIKDGKRIAIAKNTVKFSQYKGKKYNLADRMIQEQWQNYQKVPSDLVHKINNAYFSEFKNAKHSNDNLASISANNPEVIILDRMEYICDSVQETCYAINVNLDKYFYDYGHHTLKGANFFAQRVDDIGWLDSLLKAK